MGRRNCGRPPSIRRERSVRALRISMYFSLLSASRVGVRDINVGSWIARLQSREYLLYGTGWVRTIAGIQSLFSVYKLRAGR
jgi:hypothetical protein